LPPEPQKHKAEGIVGGVLSKSEIRAKLTDVERARKDGVKETETELAELAEVEHPTLASR